MADHVSEPPSGPAGRTQRVHVTNLPREWSVREIRRWCRDLGVEGAVHLARDPRSGRFAGEAYVATSTAERAEEAAAKLDGQRIDGALIEAVRVEGDAFFDQDGLFADGEAPMGRQDGRGPKPDRRVPDREDGDT